MICKKIVNLKCKVSRVVVQAAAEHERQHVLHGVRFHDAIAGDGADAAVGQRGRYDGLALSRHLEGARLEQAK